MEMIDPQIAGYLAAVALVAQFVGKLIPDSATGALGVIRKIAKIVGIYIPNKK